MPLTPEKTPPGRNLVMYILCPNEAAKVAAMEKYNWEYARFIILPQSDNPFLESIIFMDHLNKCKHEWKDKEFVGCISHSAIQKQPLLSRMDELIDVIHDEGADFCALLYRGDPLIDTAEKWHPGFTSAWIETWKRLGFERDVYMSNSTPSFYANYFLTTPALMTQYCTMMTYLKFWFDSDGSFRTKMLVNSSYDDRGETIAKITTETKQKLFGSSFYPMSIFVCERVPCVFFNRFAKKKLLVR